MKISPLKNQEVIQLLYNKDPEVTGHVFENLKKQIKKFLHNQRINQISDSEELALEVISAFYRKKSIPFLKSNYMAYLMTMARKMWYDKKTLNKEFPTSAKEIERLSPVDNVFNQTCEDERLLLLNRILNRISKKCRVLLQLAIKMKDVKQICQLMEYESTNSYYKKKNDCKKRFRDLAEDDEECCLFFNLSKASK